MKMKRILFSLKKKILIHAATWMNPEDILSKIRHKRSNIV